MSAWTKGLDNAPKDKMLFARHSDWQCPAVIKHMIYDVPCNDAGDTEWWIYCEDLINDVTGGIEESEWDDIEWMEIPE